MKRSLLILLTLIMAPYTQSATGEAKFLTFPEFEFSPSRKQDFSIPFQITSEAEVEVAIYTFDKDLVRILKPEKTLKAGVHQLVWDGKDQNGVVVPDEAYIPVLTIKKSNIESEVIDSREYSGGEVINDLSVSIFKDNIAFTLPKPSRVLIRAGISGGPMLRALAAWEPRAAGRNIQSWDGYDQDHLVNISSHKNLSVVVNAYELPEHSIITTGNQEITYRDYRNANNWPKRRVKPEDRKLVRNKRRIHRNYYIPQYENIHPETKLRLLGNSQSTKKGVPLITKQVSVQVDIPKMDKWFIQESQYEVAFYIDHEFVAEEEQGYVPLTWRWDPQGLIPGSHIITVNIIGFGGQVGVRSLRFSIPEH